LIERCFVFVLLPTFQAPLDQVDTILEEHRGWLDEHCSAGRFLVFGRRVPRDGGFILAADGDRTEIERMPEVLRTLAEHGVDAAVPQRGN
jgi:uncharacterized protein YciI